MNIELKYVEVVGHKLNVLLFDALCKTVHIQHCEARDTAYKHGSCHSAL